ncbi:MAG: hypothetical protein MJZ60_04540 [Bacteroidaceae bacterium]|nr:hypothetical protein [Bacteroidaceae bacterium]
MKLKREYIIPEQTCIDLEEDELLCTSGNVSVGGGDFGGFDDDASFGNVGVSGSGFGSFDDEASFGNVGASGSAFGPMWE